MPRYDFQCKECGHKFTAKVAIAERDQVKCPQCHGDVKQLMTGFMFSGGSNAGSVSHSSCNVSYGGG